MQPKRGDVATTCYTNPEGDAPCFHWAPIFAANWEQSVALVVRQQARAGGFSPPASIPAQSPEGVDCAWDRFRCPASPRPFEHSHSRLRIAPPLVRSAILRTPDPRRKCVAAGVHLYPSQLVLTQAFHAHPILLRGQSRTILGAAWPGQERTPRTSSGTEQHDPSHSQGRPSK